MYIYFPDTTIVFCPLGVLSNYAKHNYALYHLYVQCTLYNAHSPYPRVWDPFMELSHQNQVHEVTSYSIMESRLHVPWSAGWVCRGWPAGCRLCCSNVCRTYTLPSWSAAAVYIFYVIFIMFCMPQLTEIYWMYTMNLEECWVNVPVPVSDAVGCRGLYEDVRHVQAGGQAQTLPAREVRWSQLFGARWTI